MIDILFLLTVFVFLCFKLFTILGKDDGAATRFTKFSKVFGKQKLMKDITSSSSISNSPSLHASASTESNDNTPIQTATKVANDEHHEMMPKPKTTFAQKFINFYKSQQSKIPLKRYASNQPNQTSELSQSEIAFYKMIEDKNIALLPNDSHETYKIFAKTNKTFDFERFISYAKTLFELSIEAVSSNSIKDIDCSASKSVLEKITSFSKRLTSENISLMLYKIEFVKVRSISYGTNHILTTSFDVVSTNFSYTLDDKGEIDKTAAPKKFVAKDIMTFERKPERDGKYTVMLTDMVSLASSISQDTNHNVDEGQIKEC